MLFKVFHADEPTFCVVEARCPEILEEFPNGFTHVANVECADLEKVFYLTNHVDCSWLEHAEVEVLVETARSTSVGDIVVDSEGNIFLCMSSGWKNLTETRICETCKWLSNMYVFGRGTSNRSGVWECNCGDTPAMSLSQRDIKSFSCNHYKFSKGD